MCFIHMNEIVLRVREGVSIFPLLQCSEVGSEQVQLETGVVLSMKKIELYRPLQGVFYLSYLDSGGDRTHSNSVRFYRK